MREAVLATEPSREYTTYLTIIALAGWALTSYDMNLLVLTIPDISQNLGLSQSQVGSLIFFVTAAQFVVALFAGYGMDTLGLGVIPIVMVLIGRMFVRESDRPATKPGCAGC